MHVCDSVVGGTSSWLINSAVLTDSPIQIKYLIHLSRSFPCCAPVTAPAEACVVMISKGPNQ
ncbi:unnamed protein product [Leptidea sinapis]|uniref:Uncharacterized protein n=1 Tax=Leptidea sinapis TaxID=189913 RepID=A0A5E4PV28_9NEOP|nr:unnamed protein product [Leptidea sinapis]